MSKIFRLFLYKSICVRVTELQKRNYFLLFFCDKLIKILTLPFSDVYINPRLCRGLFIRFLKSNMFPIDAEIIKTIR